MSQIELSDLMKWGTAAASGCGSAARASVLDERIQRTNGDFVHLQQNSTRHEIQAKQNAEKCIAGTKVHILASTHISQYATFYP